MIKRDASLVGSISFYQFVQHDIDLKDIVIIGNLYYAIILFGDVANGSNPNPFDISFTFRKTNIMLVNCTNGIIIA